MKILILGDVMGQSENALKNLPKVLSQNKIEFIIISGENWQMMGEA